MHDIHVPSRPARGGRRSVVRRPLGQALRGGPHRLLRLGLLLTLLAALAAPPAGAAIFRQEDPFGGGSGSGDLAGDPDDGEHCIPVPETPLAPEAMQPAPAAAYAMVPSLTSSGRAGRFVAAALAPRAWAVWLTSLWSAGSPVACPAWLVIWNPSSHR